MNYDHAFHAGNFADVVKHAILSRIVAHLLRKDTPFRVIDTHAGSGIYDLGSAQAGRNPEWREGIARMIEAQFDAPAQALLAGYLDAVRACNPDGRLTVYPGSPALIRAWLRPQDRLIACELHPGAAKALAHHLRHGRRARAVAIDGWTALSAYIPPKERRGLVLVDPPYEREDEFDRLASALAAAFDKWPTGIFMAWYPIKDAERLFSFRRRLRRLPADKLLRVELIARQPHGSERLRGSGQIVVNAPWTLEQELRVLLPALAAVLARDIKNAWFVGGLDR